MNVWLAATLQFFHPAGDPALTHVDPHAGMDAAGIVAAFECGRCHDGTGIEAAPTNKHCVHCHQDIHRGDFDAPPKTIARWKKNIVDLTGVPSLVAVGKRLKREWIADFLRDPHDVRPGMTATMPYLPLSQAQASTLAAWLVPSEAPPADLSGGDPARGKKLLGQKACTVCHAVTLEGLEVGPLPVKLSAEQMRDGIMLAPDLAQTRRRFQSGRLLAWLKKPSAVKPDTLMPDTPMTDQEALDIAAFILSGELKSAAPEPMPEREPPLKRRVTYDEVSKVVFKHTCWHCHSEPDYARGDGGPGNTGGFGFKARGLSLADYSGVASGYIADDGERHSVFEKMPDGTPRLVAALWARHSEVRGKPVDGIRGMPLGLPPLPPEQIRLVASWIEQGRPL